MKTLRIFHLIFLCAITLCSNLELKTPKFEVLLLTIFSKHDEIVKSQCSN